MQVLTDPAGRKTTYTYDANGENGDGSIFVFQRSLQGYFEIILKKSPYIL